MSASLTSRSAGIRILFEQIRTHEEMRGNRRALSWANAALHIDKLNPTYRFHHQAYSKWFNSPDRGVDEKVLINVELFVQHFDKYTDRGARSAARAAARRILDEEINLGDETEREDQDMTTVDDTQTQPRQRGGHPPHAGSSTELPIHGWGKNSARCGPGVRRA